MTTPTKFGQDTNPRLPRWAVVAVIVLAVVLVAGTIIAWTTRSRPQSSPYPVSLPDTTPCVDVSTNLPTSLPGQAAQAPDGGGLELVETGYSQITRDGQAQANGPYVSLGAMVENTSTYVAYRARFTYQFLDAQGTSTLTINPPTPPLMEIPIILPGQRIGIGIYESVRDVPGTGWAKVDQTQVTFGTAHWTTADAETFAEVTARHLQTQIGNSAAATGLILYELSSPYCEDLVPRGASVVFRDSDEKIIGGGFELSPLRISCESGLSEQRALAELSHPAHADDNRTSIYPYCDILRSNYRLGSPDRPVN